MHVDHDRRAEIRRPQATRFVFHHAARRSEIVTGNVSRAGAFFHSALCFPVGTLLVIEVSGPRPGGAGIRLLARVAHARRGFPVRGRDSGMGVRWVRAFSAEGAEVLSRFLREVLGLPVEAAGNLGASELGDATYDFPALLAPPRVRPAPPQAPGSPSPSPAPPPPRPPVVRDALAQRKIEAVQRGRFPVRTPVIFSVENMHYQGRATSIGSDGLTIESSTGLPVQFCQVAVRYPLGQGRLGERVVLFGEVDLVSEGAAGEPGTFNLHLTGLDEQDNPGAFRSYLRLLAGGSPRI